MSAPSRPSTATLLLTALLAAGAMAAAAHDDAPPAAAVAASGPDYVIHAGTLLAEPGKPALTRQSILVQGGRIVGIRDGFVAGDHVVDLSRHYVLPGLINLHTHVALPGFASVGTWPLQRPARMVLDSIPRLKAILAEGFTTIRDLGDESGVMYDLARAVDAGQIEGPRILASEAFFGIGRSYVSAYAAGLRDEAEPFYASRGACASREECREAVREEVRRGAAVIKIRLSYLPMVDDRIEAVESVEELKWIVDMARQLHRTVAIHTVVGKSAAPVTNAIQAGVDTIEHGPLTEEQVALMKKMGTAYVPTLATARLMQGDYPGLYDRIRASAALAVKAGLTIGFGSDLPLLPVQRSHEEFQAFREAGLSNTEIIKTATVNAARILRMSGRIGTIAPGRDADIIATAENPEQDLTALGRITFVMKGGTVVKQTP